MKLLSNSFLSLGPLILIACGPIQGYPGPELPAERILAFYASADSGEIDLEGVEVAGREFDVRGITLLPGNHAYRAFGLALGEAGECEYYGKMDYSGLKRCQEKSGMDDKCNCFDFLEVRKRCYRLVRSFTCAGSFVGEARKTYTLSLGFDHADELIGSVAESSTSKPAISCSSSLGPWRQQIEDTSEGHGQIVATFRGVYRCG